MRKQLTTHQAAQLMGVSPSAVLSWIDRGWLPAYRTPGGHRRIEREAFVAFLERRGMPMPKKMVPATRLLVIDDEPAFLRTVRRLVAREAPTVEVALADSPFEGLLAVSTFDPEAVLLDTYMPGLDGLEVSRRLSHAPKTAHIRIVAISNAPSEGLAERYREAGATAFLSKPLDVHALLGLLGHESTKRRWGDG